MRRFRPLRRLGSGSMAEVHLADLDLEDGTTQRVAVKRMLPTLRIDPEVRQRFVEEGELSQRLDHPHIAKVIRAEADAEDPFIAFELLVGPSVEDLIERLKGQPADAALALHVARCTAAALAYAHKLEDDEGKPLGLVHRDVSPKNLLFDGKGGVKLIDFGLARGGRARRTRTGAVIGGAGYLSPEQARGEDADRRSDVFSCGLVLYVLATGRHPFAASTEVKQLQRIDRCRVKVPELLGIFVPDGLVRVMLRALSRRPQDRYRDGGELLEALDRARAEVPEADALGASRRLAALGFDQAGEKAPERTIPTASLLATQTAGETRPEIDLHVSETQGLTRPQIHRPKDFTIPEDDS